MERFRPYAVSGLCALTLFIWGNRIWLAWTNDEDSLGRKLVWSLPITVFVILATLLMVGFVLRRLPEDPRFVPAVRLLAGGTVIYWAVRAPMILLADHPGGFKAVHAVLAVASVISSACAWMAVSDRRELESSLA